MTYLDTSVALAHILSEPRQPTMSLWSEPLVASRLLEYETWTRVHARNLAGTHGPAVRALLSRVAMLEVVPPVVERVRHPFPAPVRTLDALHLATADYLRTQGQHVEIATYDERLALTARAMGFAVLAL